jgi:pyridoxal phosphate-dependent aminotransferase EpsN
MTGEEQKFIQEAFDTNWIAPLGPHVDLFEQEVASYLGEGLHGAALCSGTAAIHLALVLAGVKPGDFVVCQSLTFIGSTNPISYCGAIPVLVDSETTSWNMDPALLEKALMWCKAQGKPAKAVIPVNLYGQSADMEPIISLARTYGAVVVEDAAESLGATYKGKKSGSFGDYVALSFNGNKIITTSGGGMLLSRNRQEIESARNLAAQARDPAPYYLHSKVGYNYRLSNICAGIGRAQLRALDQRVARRREIHRRYADELSSIPGISFMPEAPCGTSSRWLSVMLIDHKIQPMRPLDVVNNMAEKRIECRPVWKPLHSQPLYTEVQFFSNQSRSNCDLWFDQGLCLPSGSSMTQEQQSQVIDSLLSMLRR